MGVADRKEREKAEMKTKILEAAKELFLDKGFDKTSIRNIADKIEYSPGTLYLYFKDKNELLLQLHKEAFQSLIKVFSNIKPHPKAIDRLEDLGRNYLKFAFENPELYDLMFIMEAPMQSLDCKDEIWDDGMLAFEVLRVLVKESQEEGYLTNHDTEDASLMVWSFMHGLITLKTRQRLDFFCDEEKQGLNRMTRAFECFLENIKCSKKL